MPLVDLTESGFILFAVINESSKIFARDQSSGVPSKELSHVKLRQLSRFNTFQRYPEVFQNS